MAVCSPTEVNYCFSQCSPEAGQSTDSTIVVFHQRVDGFIKGKKVLKGTTL